MRTIFSNEEMVELRKNPCVFSCTNNSVNYTYEFKKRAIELHAEGVPISIPRSFRIFF